ncbi:MAG: hypothetical protein IT406_02150 [Candidatus Yanofskybacteria bacterium]|nr:hypothetical protein [Candidatus Yanofskybacteria bacterium]
MSNVLDLKNPETINDEAVGAETAAPESGSASVFAGLVAPRTISWEAHHPLQGRAWQRHYMLMAGLVFLGGAVAWWQSSIAVLVVTFLGAATWEIRERFSRPVRVAVDERGVDIDGRRIAHAHLSSFDLHQMPDDTVELSLRTGRWYIPHVRLPLGAQDPEEVRAVLSQYVIEDEHPVPVLDAFIRRP